MGVSDISNYNLEELNQAFDHVDDLKYPGRAEELYLRIKELQTKEGVIAINNQEVEKKKTKKSRFKGVNVFRFLYYFFLACFFRVNPLLVSFLENQEQELKDKTDRIKDRLARSPE